MGQEQSSPVEAPKQEETAVEVPKQDGGLESAASALSALMGDGDTLPPHDQDAEAAEATPEAPESKEAPAKAEAKAPDEGKAPAAITLKIGDKEYSIPADQIPEELRDVVKDGLLMRADYSRKTAEAAEVRKAAEAKAQQVDLALQTASTFPEHLAAIRTVEAQLKQFQSPELWQRIQAADPSGIQMIQAKQALQDLVNQRQALYGELERAHGQVQQFTQGQLTERMQAALPKVKEAIPDYTPALAKEMREYAKSIGATDAQLDTIYDAAPLVILRKAMLYDQLQAQAKDTTNKVEKLPPKVVRSGTSSQGQGPTVNQSAMDRLQRGGKLEDAAAAIKSLMG